MDKLAIIRGGGDLGTGVAVRLYRAGFDVVVLETGHPVAVRRTVAFAEAVYEGCWTVEGITAVRAADVSEVPSLLARGVVPVLVDGQAAAVPALSPYAVIDAVMAKRNLGTRLDLAPCVVALGPGFTAGVDADAVVETNRGPRLGRVYWEGTAEPNTGVPGSVGGRAADRVLRAPVSGKLVGRVRIGEVVEEGQVVATLEGEPIRAAFRGMVRGLARDGLEVPAGLKVGDIDPRIDPTLCTLVSDKALAVAGGVLEAVLTMRSGRRR